jgi:hypothetical protein
VTDFFADKSASGTGAGTSPANAFTSIASGWSQSNSTTNIQYGDRLWVRRTHVEVVNSCVAGGKLGKAGWAYDKKIGGIIGWPKSGDPFYDVRPAAGVTAGWDSDVSTVWADINKPAMVCSGAAAANIPTLNFGSPYANFLFVSSNSAAWSTAFIEGISGLINATLLNQFSWGTTMKAVGDLTIIASLSSVVALFSGNGVWADRIILPSSTQIGFLMQATATSGFRISELVTDGNVGALMLNSSGVNASGSQFNHCVIERIRGATQVLSNALGANGGFNQIVRINDWYGQGPRIIGGFGLADWSLAPNSSAVYSGTPANVLHCDSAATQWSTNHASNLPEFIIRQVVAVTSGVPVVARFPVFFVNTSIMEYEKPWQAQLMCAGGGFAYCSTPDVGSLGPWAGTSVSVGSAWGFKFSWVPTATDSQAVLCVQVPNFRTNSHQLDMFFPPFCEVGSA